MKNNISIIALDCDLKNKICKKLSKKLGMFFADINSLIKYDLINIKKVIKEAGLEYYNKIETKTVKSVSSFENALITLNLSTFFNNDNYKILKEGSLLIYLRQNRKSFESSRKKDKTYGDLLEEKVFSQRDEVLKSICDIVVECKDKDKNIEDKVIEKIKKYYEVV